MLAGAELLAQEASNRRKSGGAVYLHGVKEQPLRTLIRGGYMAEIGEENLFETKTEAITQIFSRLDKNICTTCEKRIFLECQQVPKKRAAVSEPVDKTEKQDP